MNKCLKSTWDRENQKPKNWETCGNSCLLATDVSYRCSVDDVRQCVFPRARADKRTGSKKDRSDLGFPHTIIMRTIDTIAISVRSANPVDFHTRCLTVIRNRCEREACCELFLLSVWFGPRHGRYTHAVGTCKCCGRLPWRVRKCTV